MYHFEPNDKGRELLSKALDYLLLSELLTKTENGFIVFGDRKSYLSFISVW